MALPTAPLRALIADLAWFYRLPDWGSVPAPTWLEAQVLQESSGNPKARRYEPHLDRVSDGDTLGADDVHFEDDASYGLMQILGSNARAQLGIQKGVRMSFAFLYDPPIGLAFGCRHLVMECFPGRVGDVAGALAVYNGGPRGALVDPVTMKLRRQDYVDLVANRVRLVTDDARFKEPVE